MRYQTLLCVALTLACSAQGCVMSSTFEALEAKYATSQDELQACQQSSQTLQQQIQQLEQQKAGLEQAKAKLEADLANLLTDKTQLQASVDEMTAALAELQKRKAEADARIAEYKAFIAKFQKLIDEGKLKVKIRDGKMVVELATDVLFASGSAKLSEDGAIAIREVARVLQTIPEREFQVEGHTDNKGLRRDGKYASNWELAAARAITVVETMVEAGMPAARVSAASYGESKPVADNSTEAGRTQNRRIEIVVFPDLSTLPGFSELQNM